MRDGSTIPCRKDIFDSTLSGSARPSTSPSLSLRPLDETTTRRSKRLEEPQTLEEIHEQEGEEPRKTRLLRLFSSLKRGEAQPQPVSSVHWEGDDDEHRAALRQAYADDLWAACGGENRSEGPTWDRFLSYITDKERELYRVFHTLDSGQDNALDKSELRQALDRAGLHISPEILDGFVYAFDRNGDGRISFTEWREILLLLPRATSLDEIFRFYAVSHLPRHTSTQVTADGDVVPTENTAYKRHFAPSLPDAKGKATAFDDENEGDDFEEEEEEHGLFAGAGRSFLAGGIAGAVSRTATAPFDRLKVYLINQMPEERAQLAKKASPAEPVKAAQQGASALKGALQALYKEGGVRALWVGNGLNIVKIFPESAIKYASYETSKRAFAKYWDQVEDTAHISNGSRFVAGGIGGLTSQLSIYWIETLKTRTMSSTSGPNALKGNSLVIATAKSMYREGGMRSFFRGLTLGLIGVFPYSSIDMSLYDIMRKAYLASTKYEEPGPLASLCFGATSGGLGAATVYPLNLVRTRLQTQGTPSHPRKYSGFREVVSITYAREGVRGFYKGLTPTLMKVAPSVGLSWMTFEASKKLLFAAAEDA